MANPESVILKSLGAVSSDSAGDAVDLGDLNRALSLVVQVSIFTKNDPDNSDSDFPTLTLKIETSADGLSDWVESDFLQVKETGSYSWAAADLNKFVRLSWSLNLLDGATFSVSGSSQTVYCSYGDIKRYGLTGGALEELTKSEVVESCLAATDEADGYIGNSRKLPLVSWGQDLTLHCSKIATRYILDRRGWAIDGSDEVIEKAFDRAIDWLKRLADGKISPPGMVDSSLEIHEESSYVATRVLRNWN